MRLGLYYKDGVCRGWGCNIQEAMGSVPATQPGGP